MLEGLPKTTAAIQSGIDDNRHLGAQVSVALDGKLIADGALGEAGAGRPLRADSILLWASSTKPVTAVAVAQLWEAGRLELDDPVAQHLPEFAAEGKAGVTIRHLLTHTSGIKQVNPAAPFTTEWEELVRQVCASSLQPDWVPGRRAGYGPAGWIALAEIVARITGRPYGDHVREQIFLPLGMDDCWIGLPPDRFEAYGDRIATMYDTSEGEARPLPVEVPSAAARCNPAGGGRGPARQLLRFYEMLLGRGQLEGVSILRPPTVEALTATHRVGLVDQIFRTAVPWGLGFVVNHPVESTEGFDRYGPHASARTFGHGGRQSSVGFADPDAGLAVAVIFNGMAGQVPHWRRAEAVYGAIYEDLGLT